MPNKERELVDLLCELFEDPAHLLRFLRFAPLGDRLFSELAQSKSLQRTVLHAVDVLRRHGLVAGDFFDHLREEFRNAGERISAVEENWIPSIESWSSDGDVYSSSSDSTPDSRASTVFVSYSRRDIDFRDELLTHLKILQRQGFIDVWSEGRIRAGDHWESVIRSQVDEADIIVLLISPDFLSSDFVWNIELRRAIERQQSGTARVLPVIVRDCDWQGTPLSAFQMIPADGIPISARDDTDAAWLEVASALRSISHKQRASKD